MPVRNAQANVTLLRMMMIMTTLLLYHSDARPFMNCRRATTADKRQLSVVASSACPTAVSQLPTQQPHETLADAVTPKSSTVQQVTQRA